MLHYKHEFKYNYGQITKTNTTTNTRYGNYSNRLMTADSLQIYNPFKCTNGVCKSEIYCFIHLHSLLRIVFVIYIFANLSAIASK